MPIRSRRVSRYTLTYCFFVFCLYNFLICIWKFLKFFLKGIEVELVGKQVRVSTDMAIFITMNPGYAGRSNLPDNLKKLFRSLAMTTPDRQLIAEVMLFSQGFRTAEKLACKIVPFFKLCDEQLSNQSHYDFGLRALKSVLVSAGNVKRDRIMKIQVLFIMYILTIIKNGLFHTHG